jgi:hypothetical protein
VRTTVLSIIADAIGPPLGIVVTRRGTVEMTKNKEL